MTGGMRSVWFVGLLGLALVGCDKTTSIQRTCGTGTQQVEGVCRPLLNCGEHTFQQGNECVPVAAGQPECGVGTELVETMCARSTPPVICGPSTREQDGTCVPDPEPVTCGPGTALDELEESCVAVNPLTCGVGTDRNGTECTSNPCANGTVEQNGECVAEVLTASAGFAGFCPQFARNVCDSLSRCPCPEADPDQQLLADDPEYCQVHVELGLCPQVELLLALQVAAGQFVPNLERIRQLLGAVFANDDCLVPVPYYMAEGAGNVLLELLEPAAEELDLCNSSEACVGDDLVCRAPAPPEPGDAACLPRLGLGAGCLNHTQCQAAFYCDSDAQTCQQRPALTDACSSSEPCADGACCRSDVCVELPGPFSPCCDNGDCGDPAAYYCRNGFCEPYATWTEPCEDGVRCHPGLLCMDLGEGPICLTHIPFCVLELF